MATMPVSQAVAAAWYSHITMASGVVGRKKIRGANGGAEIKLHVEDVEVGMRRGIPCIPHPHPIMWSRERHELSN